MSDIDVKIIEGILFALWANTERLNNNKFSSNICLLGSLFCFTYAIAIQLIGK